MNGPLLATLLILLLVGCNSPVPPVTETTEGVGTLTVAVAASMRFAFEEIAVAFEELHPEVKTEASFGSSGAFFAQLIQKAPFDLFLSADTDYPARLVAEGHAQEHFPYATGRLVLWAPQSEALDVANQGMAALQDPRIVTISIANPDTAPYGRAALDAMSHFGVEAGVAAKLVRGENVSQAAQFVQSGAAQIGLVAYSLTLVPPLQNTGDVWLVPETSHEALAQSGVILPWSQESTAAEAFRDFLLGPEGQTILEKHGFGAP